MYDACKSDNSIGERSIKTLLAGACIQTSNVPLINSRFEKYSKWEKYSCEFYVISLVCYTVVYPKDAKIHDRSYDYPEELKIAL